MNILTSFYSSVIGCSLLVLGFGLGFTSYSIPLRLLHLVIAFLFLLMFPLMIPVHIHRFYTKGPYDRIAWIHFVTFSILLYISIKMIRTWYFKNHSHKNEGMSSLSKVT